MSVLLCYVPGMRAGLSITLRPVGQSQNMSSNIEWKVYTAFHVLK